MTAAYGHEPPATPGPLRLVDGRPPARMLGLGARSHGIVGVVAILTAGPAAQHDHRSWGMTISSLQPVSLDPPLLLVAVAQSSRMLAAITATDGFGVSVLGADQEQIARQFAGRRRTSGTAPSSGVSWRAGPVTGSPLIAGSIGWFDCRISRITPAGDHALILGDVRFEARNPASQANPLLHGHGGYHRLRDNPTQKDDTR